MVRLEGRLAFGHARFPSADELALGDALHLDAQRPLLPGGPFGANTSASRTDPQRDLSVLVLAVE